MSNSTSRNEDRGKQIEPLSDTVAAQSASVSRCVLFARLAGGNIERGAPASSEQAHAIQRCLKRMRRAAEAFGGRTFKPTSAGAVLALFVNADSALQAASELHQRVGDLPPNAGVKLFTQAALAFGAVLIGEDRSFGETVDHADALSTLAERDQILATAEVVRRLSPPFAALGHGLNAAATIGGAAHEVFAFACSDISRAAVTGSTTTARTPQVRLILNLGSETVTVDARRAVRTLGRDIGNDLSVDEPRASRTHARIEMRTSEFVLVDVSRNGTFVQLDCGRQIVLRQQEMELPAQGQISLGRPCAADTHCISFEVVRE